MINWQVNKWLIAASLWTFVPACAATAEPKAVDEAPQAAVKPAESAKPAEGKTEGKAAAADGKAPAGEGKAAPQGKAAKATAKTPAAKDAAKSIPVKDAKPAAGTLVELKTSAGTIKVELADKDAPISVKNFLSYVNDKFYDGTVFHRVIDGFMVQGGGYTIDGDKLVEKTTRSAITNEAKNGLKNDRGTLAMARTMDPNSATAQFFINLVNNDRLNAPNPDGHGYAVFGKVVEGMDVVDKIGKEKTGMRFGMQDVPTADIKLLSAAVVKPATH